VYEGWNMCVGGEGACGGIGGGGCPGYVSE
jgi:hypothetical protein